MNILEKFNIDKSKAFKVIGLIIGGIVVLMIISSFVGLPITTITDKAIQRTSPSYSGEVGYNEVASYDSAQLDLSTRSVTVPPENGSVSGNDAEEFEVTEYSSRIETRNLERTCAVITDLKPRADVIFERANEYSSGCNYTFKVENSSASEILAIVKDLDPKEISENTYTIKQRLEDYTSELEILEQKLESINDTLGTALSAYDDITSIATQTQDAESLAKIIDSKVNIIERLSQERIKVNSAIERLSRSKAQQLDRLNYTYFHINIYENKYIDGDNLSDSWKSAIKNFVSDINRIAQDITINLISLILLILQYALYILIVVLVAKYGWVIIKRIWNN